MNRRTSLTFCVAVFLSGLLVAFAAAPAALGIDSGNADSANRKSSDNPALLAQERKQTEALLRKLAQAEKGVLESDDSRSDAPEPMYVAAADTSQLEQRLQEVLQSNRQLQSQQERFVSEIIRLKERVRDAESRSVEAHDEAAEKREEALREELAKERQMIDRLERKIDEQQTAYKEQLRQQHNARSLLEDLENERARAEKYRKTVEQLQAELEQAKRGLSGQKELRGNLVKTRQAAERLELELQYKAQIEKDNEHLRAELIKAKQAGSKAADAAAAISKLKALEAEKRELELEAATQRTRITQDAEKLRALNERSEALLARISLLERQLEEKNNLISATANMGSETRKLQQEIARLTDALNREREAKENREAEAAETNAVLAKHKKALRMLKDKYDEQKALIAEKDQEVVASNRRLSQVVEEARVCSLSVEDTKGELAKLGQLEAELKGAAEQLAMRQGEVETCQNGLKETQAQLAKLAEVEKELITTRNQLMLKETELELLSKASATSPAERARMVNEIRRSHLAKVAELNRSLQPKAVLQTPQVIPAAAAPAAAAEPVSLADVVIIEVTAGKVNLRSGPGKEHSPIMQVQEGTRLTVEDREGDWYRVFTPTGARAYVQAGVVKVIDNGNKVRAAQVSMAQAPNQAPAQPPARALREDREVVPFGSVKLAGRSEAQDLESRALEHIRANFQRRDESEGQ